MVRKGLRERVRGFSSFPLCQPFGDGVGAEGGIHVTRDLAVAGASTARSGQVKMSHWVKAGGSGRQGMRVKGGMRGRIVERWGATSFLSSTCVDWHLEKKDALSLISSLLHLQGEGFFLEHCGPGREASLKF